MQARRYLIALITCVFFGLVVFFLFKTLSDVNWHEVFMALRNLHWTVLFFSLLAVFINYAILSSYDFLGLRYLGVGILSYPKVLWSAFVSYVFNLNLGAWVGGIGMRLRIYGRWQVPVEKIPQVMLFSFITNWMGYVLLLAVLFTTRGPEVSRLIPFPVSAVRLAGILGLFLVALYLVFSWKRFELKWRTRRFVLPGLKLALLQLVLASLQWMLLSGILTMILHGLNAKVDFGDVLFTYLLASLAGVITHIPGGLGVLEAVFLKMGLGVPKSDLLVALICFRALYYLVPLGIGVPSYFMLEIYQKRKIQSPL